MVIRMIILLGFSMLLASSPLVAEPAPSMLSDQGQRLLMGPIEWAAGEGETPTSKEPVKRVKKEGGTPGNTGCKIVCVARSVRPLMLVT